MNKSNDALLYNYEMEAAALGCVFLDSNLIDDLLARNSESWFADPRHRNILKRMKRLREAGSLIDTVSVLTAGPAEEIGGSLYLSMIPDATPSAHNFPHYFNVIKAKAKRRHLFTLANQLQHNAEVIKDDAEFEVAADKTITGLFADVEAGGEVTASAAAHSALEEIEKAMIAGQSVGLHTGFHALDLMTGGFQNGEMTVLAARPSMGKTALAINMAVNIATKKCASVGVLSLEMTSTSLMVRMLSSYSGVDSYRLRSGKADNNDLKAITNAAAKLSAAKLIINDTSSVTASQLRGYARKMKTKHKIQLLVIDYLQLVSAKAESRTQEITQISSAIKSIAKELNIPVLVLSQLNREVEKQERVPRLSDLRESGAIEQDADVVMLLHRPDASNHSAIELVVAKQRNGPTGAVELEWHAPTTTFRNPPTYNTYHAVDK